MNIISVVNRETGQIVYSFIAPSSIEECEKLVLRIERSLVKANMDGFEPQVCEVKKVDYSSIGQKVIGEIVHNQISFKDLDSIENIDDLYCSLPNEDLYLLMSKDRIK